MRSQVTGDSLVTYKNVEVTVDFLESQGLVTRNPDGSYTSFGQGDAASPPTSPSVEQANVTDTEQAPEQAPDQFPDTPEGRRGAATAIEDALKQDGNLAGSLFEEAVELWEDGPGLVDASSPRIAELLGKNAENVMGSLQEYHAQEAAWVAGQNGVVDMQGFLEFVQSKPGAMREAITRAVLEGDANTAWGSLAREYARDHAVADHDPADILGADFGPGVTVARGPDGTPWITVDDFNGPWREAVRRGVIKVSST